MSASTKNPAMIGFQLVAPPLRRGDERPEATLRLVERLMRGPITRELTDNGQLVSVLDRPALFDSAFFGDHGPEHHLMFVEGAVSVLMAGGNPMYRRGHEPQHVEYDDFSFAACIPQELVVDPVHALIELGDELGAWYGTASPEPEDPLLKGRGNQRTAKLGWLNYWSADVAQQLGFPGAEVFGPWRALARQSPRTGAWILSLTLEPFDSSVAEHLAVLLRARQRLGPALTGIRVGTPD